MIAGLTRRFEPILARAALPALLALALSGCGVRQFNGKIHNAPSLGRFTAGFGPFYAAGQNGNTMSTSSCASGAGHHPCARARASVGMPYQYDVNPNTAVGAITGGTGFVPGAYVGTAGGPQGNGAGKTKGAPWQATSRGDQPRGENRDLHIMQRQTAGGQQVF